MRDGNSLPGDLQDYSNADVEEALSSYVLPLDNKLTEVEYDLRNELKMLKQMRVYLNDLNQEANIQRVKEDTNKKVKNTEKAKEEAMKLLKSGAISFGNATEKHVFKRKARESDVFSGDVEDASGIFASLSTNASRSTKSKKMNLYENFVYGERMQATSQLPTKLPSEPYLSDITSSADANRSEKFGRSPVSLDDQTTETQQTNKSSSRHAQESSSPSNHSYFKEDPYNRRRGGLTIYINCCDISESLIRQVLEPYGSIQRIRLDERKSYAFVTLSSPEEAEKALQLDRTMFDNRRLRVNYARRQFTYSNEGDLSHADRYRPSLRSCGPSRTAKSEAPPQETGSRNLVDYGDVDL